MSIIKFNVLFNGCMIFLVFIYACMNIVISVGGFLVNYILVEYDRRSI